MARVALLIGAMNVSARLTAAVVLTCAVGSPAVAAPPKKIGRAMITYYWTIDESAPRYRARGSSVLHDSHGRVIALTSRRFRHDLIREGCGVLRDGRTVMYDRSLRGERCFSLTSSKYGLAKSGCPLEPYRTIAVDPRFVKLGSRLFIPAFKGARLPDGTVHDGVFVACDCGHFRGRHIDLFVGAGVRSARPFLQMGIHSRSRVTVYLLDSAGACHG